MSQKGSSFKLLQLIPKNLFSMYLSVPLILEYESVLSKNTGKLKLSKSDIDDFLNYICSISEHTPIYYLWRPTLKDPYDDHILELAVSSNSKYIVTFNISDFEEADTFGIYVVSPEHFLEKLRG